MPNSDPPATTPPGEAVPKKKSKFKLIMLLLAVLLLLGGGGGGAYWFLTKDSDFSLFSFFSSDEKSDTTSASSSSSSVATGNTTNTDTSGTIGISQIVSLPTLTVNLTDPTTPRYLRIGIDVEVSSADAITAINNQTAKIRDAIIILLSSKTYSQLATADGKLQLKNEIAARINQILNAPRVVQIYFTDFVIQ